jgi:dolichyl-phosphate-mannose--protein O-mannosyl transferase
MRLTLTLHRVAAWRHAWLVVLALLLAASLIARLWDLSAPCARPCRTPGQHTLIFDEAYYVNAARVIDGIEPPPGQPYAGSPTGADPNAEHPQLAKLIIAGFIELFGNDPWGWRTGSVLFGMLALVGMFALVRAAGGSRWLAVGATAVMAADNLVLVHSRIATLDIYALALMLWGGAAYLRRRPLLAGGLLGIAGCMKLVGLLPLASFLLLEAMRLWQARRLTHPRAVLAAVARLAAVGVAASAVLIGGIWLMDLGVPAYDPGTHRFYRGNPIAHLAHMFSFAARLTTHAGAPGVSSSPWQWLLDQKPIPYARTVATTLVNHTVITERVIVFFRGEVNPFIIFLAIPALFAAAAAVIRARREASAARAPDHPHRPPLRRDEVAAVALAWSIGTFVPFVIESDAFHRVTYLFYILVVMPGIYLALAALFARLGAAASIGWAVALGFGFVHQYPIRTLSGH